MKTCLKYLLPMSCLLLIGSGVWMLLVRTRTGHIVGGAIAAALALAVLIYGIATTPPSAAQGRREQVY
jgi:hypothetical protein